MAGNLFGKMAADTLGLSDIGKIISPKDFDKVDGDDYIMNEDGEKIYFVIKSKSDEYVFTNRGLLHVDGDSAVNLPNKLYNVGSTLDFKFSASNETIVEVYIGWMNGNTMLINDIAIPIDEEIAKRNGSVTFTFRLRGETE